MAELGSWCLTPTNWHKKHGVSDGFVLVTTQSYLVNCNGRTIHY
jgi:hypothetical protein